MKVKSKEKAQLTLSLHKLDDFYATTFTTSLYDCWRGEWKECVSLDRAGDGGVQRLRSIATQAGVV